MLLNAHFKQRLQYTVEVPKQKIKGELENKGCHLSILFVAYVLHHLEHLKGCLYAPLLRYYHRRGKAFWSLGRGTRERV